MFTATIIQSDEAWVTKSAYDALIDKGSKTYYIYE